jgi:hypothetical protein
MKLISIKHLLAEAGESDLKQAPTLIKHCTLAVYKNRKFKPKKGTRAFAAMNMCRHVMTKPWHHHKDGLSAFYKRGSHKGKVSDMKRTQRGVRRDFKHAFERGGARKTSHYNFMTLRFEREYNRYLKRLNRGKKDDDKKSGGATGTKQGKEARKAKAEKGKEKEKSKKVPKKEKSPLRRSTQRRIERDLKRGR